MAGHTAQNKTATTAATRQVACLMSTPTGHMAVPIRGTAASALGIAIPIAIACVTLGKEWQQLA